MFFAFLIFWSCVFCVACGALAERNGRNPVSAGFLGLFFGIFALFGYLIAGKTLAKQAEDYKRLQELLNK